MFRVRTGNYEMAIVFATDTIERLTAEGTEMIDQTRALVHIFEPRGESPISGKIGFAYRAPDDTPDKWEGRMWALTRAMQGCPEPAFNDVMDAFWDAREADEHRTRRAQELATAKERMFHLFAESESLMANIRQLEAV